MRGGSELFDNDKTTRISYEAYIIYNLYLYWEARPHSNTFLTPLLNNLVYLDVGPYKMYGGADTRHNFREHCDNIGFDPADETSRILLWTAIRVSVIHPNEEKILSANRAMIRMMEIDYSEDPEYWLHWWVGGNFAPGKMVVDDETILKDFILLVPRCLISWSKNMVKRIISFTPIPKDFPPDKLPELGEYLALGTCICVRMNLIVEIIDLKLGVIGYMVNVPMGELFQVLPFKDQDRLELEGGEGVKILRGDILSVPKRMVEIQYKSQQMMAMHADGKLKNLCCYIPCNKVINYDIAVHLGFTKDKEGCEKPAEPLQGPTKPTKPTRSPPRRPTHPPPRPPSTPTPTQTSTPPRSGSLVIDEIPRGNATLALLRYDKNGGVTGENQVVIAIPEDPDVASVPGYMTYFISPEEKILNPYNKYAKVFCSFNSRLSEIFVPGLGSWEGWPLTISGHGGATWGRNRDIQDGHEALSVNHGDTVYIYPEDRQQKKNINMINVRIMGRGPERNGYIPKECLLFWKDYNLFEPGNPLPNYPNTKMKIITTIGVMNITIPESIGPKEDGFFVALLFDLKERELVLTTSSSAYSSSSSSEDEWEPTFACKDPPDGECKTLMDGSGQYTSMTDCMAAKACQAQPPLLTTSSSEEEIEVTFACNEPSDGECRETKDGSGPYTSMTDCMAAKACQAQPQPQPSGPTFACNEPSDGECRETKDGSGPYKSMAYCMAAKKCQAFIPQAVSYIKGTLEKLGDWREIENNDGTYQYNLPYGTNLCVLVGSNQLSIDDDLMRDYVCISSELGQLNVLQGDIVKISPLPKIDGLDQKIVKAYFLANDPEYATAYGLARGTYDDMTQKVFGLFRKDDGSDWLEMMYSHLEKEHGLDPREHWGNYLNEYVFAEITERMPSEKRNQKTKGLIHKDCLRIEVEVPGNAIQEDIVTIPTKCGDQDVKVPDGVELSEGIMYVVKYGFEPAPEPPPIIDLLFREGRPPTYIIFLKAAFDLRLLSNDDLKIVEGAWHDGGFEEKLWKLDGNIPAQMELLWNKLTEMERKGVAVNWEAI